jgi:hypothetical protein
VSVDPAVLEALVTATVERRVTLLKQVDIEERFLAAIGRFPYARTSELRKIIRCAKLNSVDWETSQLVEENNGVLDIRTPSDFGDT